MKNRVAVFGDVILDQYFFGEVSRVSPEAPVPVLNFSHEEFRLGGAANVANNINSLNSEVTLFYINGNDEASEEFSKMLSEKGINNNFITDPKYKLIRKVRVLSDKQQICRIDYNDDLKPNKEKMNNLYERFLVDISNFDVIVLSDYDKGSLTFDFCQKIINSCKNHNIPVLVDPKGLDWDKYEGCTLIKPNLIELAQYYNIKINNENDFLENLISKLNLKHHLLLTRAQKGMTLYNCITKSISHFAPISREVYDVSGAGDTVIATLAVFYNHEILNEVSNLSNIAAGIVISKIGTSTITYSELINAKNELIYKNELIKNKYFSHDEIINKIAYWKSINKKIVFTNGCFDVIHRGHINTLYSAAKYGDILIVAINSDQSIRNIKGDKRPINPLLARIEVLSSISFVDAVIVFEEDTPLNILKELKPDVLVKGGDYNINNIIGKEYVNEIKFVNIIKGYSSTNIIEHAKLEEKNNGN